MIRRVLLLPILLGFFSSVAMFDAQAQSQKISELNALTGADTATADELAIVDTTATETKRITRDELAIGLGGPMGIVLESAPGTAATATGTDAVGIGDGAVAGDAADDDGVLAIGARSTASGDGAIAIGENSDATGISSIALGGSTTDASSADATGNNSLAISDRANATATSAVAIGSDANATVSGAVAIGVSSDAVGDRALALGAISNSSGTRSIAIGGATTAGLAPTASTTNAIAIGEGTDATGVNCIAIGGNSTDTDSADCSAADSVAIGQHILADDIGEFAFASGEFSTQSDAHTSIYVLRRNTTDDTQGEMFTNGVASEGGSISVDSDCAVSFRINIVARATASNDFGAGYLITGVADNNAGTTALIGSVTVVTIAEDVANWDVNVTADDTNDELNVLVTGVTTNDINWVARAEVAVVCG